MKKLWILIGTLLLTVMAATGGYQYARRHGGPGMVSAPSTQGQASSARKVLYWYDPMVPNQHFDKPGKSPYMDMALVPKYAEEDTSTVPGVHIDALMQQNLGIRLASVERGTLTPLITASANVVFDDRDVAVVQAKSNAFVQRTYRLAVGDVISRGAPVASLLMPEWVGAQEEYLAAFKTGDAALAQAAHMRLVLLGMPESLIEQVQKTGKPISAVTVVAPIAGVVQSLNVRTGMTLSAGEELVRLNGLRTVWLEAEVPEAQSAGLIPGQSLTARFVAWPERRFHGHIVAILPQLAQDTRTGRVRAELPNPDGRIRPGMFAQVALAENAQHQVLLVPSEAIIHTGKQDIVMLAVRRHFMPVIVQVGEESEGKTVISSGLKAGQKIVASGEFLVDSDATLADVLPRFAVRKMQMNKAPFGHYTGVGLVEALDTSSITLSHEPIPVLGWHAMTMRFALKSPELMKQIKVGDRVQFGFVSNKQGYVVDSLRRTGDKP